MTAQQLTGRRRAMRCYELAVSGITHQQIAEKLGISQSAATRAIERGQKIALDTFKAETAGQITEQLARLNAAYATAMTSFQESRHPAARKRSIHTDRDGTPTRTASVDVTETSPGNPKFLSTALTAVRGICKLLALDAPRRIQIDLPPDGRAFDNKTKEEIEQEIADLIKVAGLDLTKFN